MSTNNFENINYDEIVKNCLVIDGNGQNASTIRDIVSTRNFTQALTTGAILRIRINMNSRKIW